MGRSKLKKIINFSIESWHPYALIIFIGFILYSKVVLFDFSYLDDNDLILNKFDFLSDITNIFKVFAFDVFNSLKHSASYYRPILTISFMVDAQLGGAAPFIYHFSNIIFHLIASCLLFSLFKRMNYRKKLSLFFALIFTVHPVLTQAVAWIPGRNDTILAIFIFLSFIYLIKLLETKKELYYYLHLFLFFLALLTKETAVVLPIIALLYLHFIKKEELISDNKKILLSGWIIVGIIWLGIRLAVLQNISTAGLTETISSLILNFSAIIQYIGKIIFPFNLSVLPIIQDTTFIFGIIAIILVLIALIKSKNKRNNYIIFGIAWFVLFLMLSLIRPNLAITPDFIEHHVYLPMFGFFILLLEFDFIKKINFNKIHTLAISILIIIFFSIITFFHSNNFKDKISFWENAVETSPHSPLAHRNLGAMYYLDGRLDEAEIESKKSLKLNSSEEMVHNNLGLIHAKRGMLKEAEIEYRKELAIQPNYDNALYNLGLLYYSQGRVEEAVELWQKTLEANPNYQDAYIGLPYIYESKNDIISK